MTPASDAASCRSPEVNYAVLSPISSRIRAALKDRIIFRGMVAYSIHVQVSGHVQVPGHVHVSGDPTSSHGRGLKVTGNHG